MSTIKPTPGLWETNLSSGEPSVAQTPKTPAQSTEELYDHLGFKNKPLNSIKIFIYQNLIHFRLSYKPKFVQLPTYSF